METHIKWMYEKSFRNSILLELYRLTWARNASVMHPTQSVKNDQSKIVGGFHQHPNSNKDL